MDEAIDAAEREALAYAGENSEYLDACQSYSLFDPVAASGVEVFSLLRESDLEPEAYVDTFFDTGEEHQRHDQRQDCYRPNADDGERQL